MRWLAAILLFGSLFGATSAWAEPPLKPALGETVVLETGESTTEGLFHCAPANGRLGVQEAVDTSDTWEGDPSTPVEVSPGICSVTLYQFPVSASAHTYYWHTRQCISYSGSCPDSQIETGATWSFVIERPTLVAPLPLPPPAPVAPPPPAEPTVTCVRPHLKIEIRVYHRRMIHAKEANAKKRWRRLLRGAEAKFRNAPC